MTLSKSYRRHRTAGFGKYPGIYPKYTKKQSAKENLENLRRAQYMTFVRIPLCDGVWCIAVS